MLEPEKLMLKTIQRLVKRRDALTHLIMQKQDLLKQVCSHSDRVIKEEYNEGGYLDMSEYNTYSVCSVCGDKKPVNETIRSYV